LKRFLISPDLQPANHLVGCSDVEIREAIGDKFPKHIAIPSSAL
jgi:hypothetical protein